MTSISLVMNTRNEAVKLRAAIESATGVDEIVIADMESSDDTLAIAGHFGATILNLPNAGVCEPGRQPAIDAATSEWILMLDADERLSAEGLDRLRILIDATPSNVVAYNLAYRTFIGPRRIESTGWDAHFEWHARLFRRTAVTWPAVVHGVPTFAGDLAFVPDELQVWVDHLNFDDLQHAYEKFNRYSTVEACDLVNTGQPVSNLSGLHAGITEFVRRYRPEIDGDTSFAMSMGLLFYKYLNHAKALEMQGWNADRALPSADSMQRAWVAFLETLSQSEIDRSRVMAQNAALSLTERIVELEQCISNYGATPDLWCDIAELRQQAGHHDAASAACEQALALDPNFFRAKELLGGIQTSLMQGRFGTTPPPARYSTGAPNNS